MTVDWKKNVGIGEYKEERWRDNRRAYCDDRFKLSVLFPTDLHSPHVYKNAPFDVCESKLTDTFFDSWDQIKHNIILHWVDLAEQEGDYALALLSDHTTSYSYGEGYPLGLTAQYSGGGLWGPDYKITHPFSSEAIKNQFIGEAKFLRALAYFDLVRYFGRIPIVLEPVSVNEAMTIKQSEPVEVYETAIVPDLEDAVKKLVDTPLNYMGNSASAGRATQVAAKSLLGRVYLTMAGYPIQDASKKTLAEELFSEVIDYSFANNKYWASTADEWIKIWISDNDNKYHIFEIQYIAAKNYGNPMVFNSVPAVNDSYTKIQMSGNRIWCENQLDGIFKQTDETGAFIDKRCAGTINTSEFVDEDGTPYTGGDFFLKFFEHKMKRKLLGYEDIDDQIADRTYFPINYPLIRLEDVMLMYAEIVGPTGKGKEMVNKIRTRAGLDALDDDITIENFADSVDIERRRELASEGIRWHDLVRQNRYVSVLQDMFKRNGSDANGVITKPETYELYKLVTKDSYIYPIPDSQMKVKEGLYEQNKGYN